MLDSGRIDTVRVDSDQADAVIKLLDSVVIRLEGGTDLDLTVLDIAQGKLIIYNLSQGNII